MDSTAPVVVDVDLADALHRWRDHDAVRARRSALDSTVGTEASCDVLLVVPLRLRLVPGAADDAGCATGSPMVLPADAGSPLRRAAGWPGVDDPGGAAPLPNTVARFAGWGVDLGSRRLTGPHAGSRTLPPAEFRLLLAFLAQPRRVIPRAALVERALQDRGVHCARTLDVYVSRLRRHLRPQRRLPGPIGTVRSVGYVLNADVEFDDGGH